MGDSLENIAGDGIFSGDGKIDRRTASAGLMIRRRPCGRSCVITKVTDVGAWVRDGAWHGLTKWKTIENRWRW
jgi:hypothetical protein